SDVRAADIPGVVSELSSEVSRSSEASGKGGGDQQKNTSGAAKTSAAAAPQPVPGEGERLEDLLPQAPVKEAAPAAPSPKESFHTASSPAKEDTEGTQPAGVLLKQGNIPTTGATQNVTTEGQEETTLSSFAADDDNAVTNDADEDNTENSGDDLASRAAVTDEKQQHQREDGSEKETAPAATPQAKMKIPALQTSFHCNRYRKLKAAWSQGVSQEKKTVFSPKANNRMEHLTAMPNQLQHHACQRKVLPPVMALTRLLRRKFPIKIRQVLTQYQKQHKIMEVKMPIKRKHQ
ncbi:mucin-associated surface protein (MASP), putative, partial [Trypanosoma cruzi]